MSTWLDPVEAALRSPSRLDLHIIMEPPAAHLGAVSEKPLSVRFTISPVPSARASPTSGLQ
jgi:hypothetical protein